MDSLTAMLSSSGSRRHVVNKLASQLPSSASSSCSAEQFHFKADNPFDQRRDIADKIRVKFPDRVPVIIERARSANSNVPDISKKKFLVPADTTVGKFLFEVRKQMHLTPEQAIFLFVGNGVLPPTAALMSQIDDRFRDDDGFLYVTYSGENTFGGA